MAGSHWPAELHFERYAASRHEMACSSPWLLAGFLMSAGQDVEMEEARARDDHPRTGVSTALDLIWRFMHCFIMCGISLHGTMPRLA